jgi:hypothetical protein
MKNKQIIRRVLTLVLTIVMLTTSGVTTFAEYGYDTGQGNNTKYYHGPTLTQSAVSFGELSISVVGGLPNLLTVRGLVNMDIHDYSPYVVISIYSDAGRNNRYLTHTQ